MTPSNHKLKKDIPLLPGTGLTQGYLEHMKTLFFNIIVLFTVLCDFGPKNCWTHKGKFSSWEQNIVMKSSGRGASWTAGGATARSAEQSAEKEAKRQKSQQVNVWSEISLVGG